MQDFKIEDFCDSFCASRRTRRMRGVFWNTNLTNGTKGFFGGLSIFVALAECVVNEGVWMWGLDSDFDAGEEAARKGGTVDVA